ncbi:MAG: SDR family NAD(P)-dependent oxidoreductase [Candidatus Freyarchaeota archaeon]|nr:SDR family NAD(P)-dependent oxidoreductase [Candidatus Jordarchaeia archaeon]
MEERALKIEQLKVLVTGGCGFIGSHLVDRLIEKKCEVVVLDNLSGSTVENIEDHIKSGRVKLVVGDVRDYGKVKECVKYVDIVFHFAAQADVRKSVADPRFDYEVNVQGTINILEAMRNSDVKEMVFASSGGTLYGEAKQVPTPETLPPCPISPYGAAKAACEMYLSAYHACYGISSLSLRYANIIGPRSTHGVIYDFYWKLRRNPKMLEILGDGNQSKSYMYVSDCVDASLYLAEKVAGFDVFNVSSEESLTVRNIAEIVVKELGLDGVEFRYIGGRGGWVGDVPLVLLDISKLKKTGWKPKVTIREGIRRYVRWLVEKYGNVER